jgi:hypothetical protein
VNTILPSSVPNDDTTAVVLYGTGFDASSRIYFDTRFGTPANVRYSSPDGTVIVFTVPTGLASGAHTAFLTNSTNTITMPSINVTNAAVTN